jgi:CRP-like cAMP-binding protein
MQGELVSTVVAVESGLVKLTPIGRSGAETIIALRGQGSILGAEEAIGAEHYVSTAITAAPTRICRIPVHAYIHAL